MTRFEKAAVERAARAIYAVQCRRERERGIELPTWEASLRGCQLDRVELALAAISAFSQKPPLRAAPLIDEAALRQHLATFSAYAPDAMLEARAKAQAIVVGGVE